MRSAIVFWALLLAGCNQTVSEPDFAEALAELANELPPVSESTWRDTGTLECRPTRMDICSPEGCESGVANIWVRWTPSTRTYERCDRNGCDTYPSAVSYSGSWANITVPESATFAKLTGRNAFFEVVTQNHAVLIYRGQCQEAAAP